MLSTYSAIFYASLVAEKIDIEFDRSALSQLCTEVTLDLDRRASVLRCSGRSGEGERPSSV